MLCDMWRTVWQAVHVQQGGPSGSTHVHDLQPGHMFWSRVCLWVCLLCTNCSMLVGSGIHTREEARHTACVSAESMCMWVDGAAVALAQGCLLCFRLCVQQEAVCERAVLVVLQALCCIACIGASPACKPRRWLSYERDVLHTVTCLLLGYAVAPDLRYWGTYQALRAPSRGLGSLASAAVWDPLPH
jgi:hypothetical protein